MTSTNSHPDYYYFFINKIINKIIIFFWLRKSKYIFLYTWKPANYSILLLFSWHWNFKSQRNTRKTRQICIKMGRYPYIYWVFHLNGCNISHSYDACAHGKWPQPHSWHQETFCSLISLTLHRYCLRFLKDCKVYIKAGCNNLCFITW